VESRGANESGERHGGWCVCVCVCVCCVRERERESRACGVVGRRRRGGGGGRAAVVVVEVKCRRASCWHRGNGAPVAPRNTLRDMDVQELRTPGHPRSNRALSGLSLSLSKKRTRAPLTPLLQRPDISCHVPQRAFPRPPSSSPTALSTPRWE
jgi:hypothetical protein